MEKINALIQQLCQLHASNASLETIRPVVQQLHLAMQHETQTDTHTYSTKGSVSVWMPTARVVADDGGNREVPEPFPQPKPEPFPQPNPEPFPNPEPAQNPEPVPDPMPQPQEPTILPPAEPATPTRLGFGVPRPPQQIFVDAVEEAIPQSKEVQHSSQPHTSVEPPVEMQPRLRQPQHQPAPTPEPIVEVTQPDIPTPSERVEPVAVHIEVAKKDEPAITTEFEDEVYTDTADADLQAEQLSGFIVPPVIDWKLLQQATPANTIVHEPVAEHQAWAGMEVEKHKEEATVVSRNVTPKDLTIDSKTLTDIDELVRGKRQALPGKSVELSELNDRLAERTRVLNETFSQHQEMAEMFNGPRIADLRRAISINEKYQYVNNLFRGDEAMFERSVKTINNFRIMAEADYWVQRELVIKLGWNPDDELAQRFYSLVKRRFS